jgi:hypothetical protein
MNISEIVATVLPKPAYLQPDPQKSHHATIYEGEPTGAKPVTPPKSGSHATADQWAEVSLPPARKISGIMRKLHSLHMPLL